MGADDIAILCTGDLHLGRRPSRVDPTDGDFSVTEVWHRIVDIAVERNVDVVALTGDVVDRDNRYYEAIGPLERGVRRLADRGIRTVAVSGNHDYDVLPRVAALLDEDHFHLLGTDGHWERRRIEFDDRPPLDVVGWSYPDRHVLRSPVADLDIDADDNTPTIGLLHTHLDTPGSNYAPVTTEELDETGVSAWLLGHIHGPRTIETSSGNLVVYPGSPQPLDPGETGIHGPWLVELSPDSDPTCRQLPAANLRYATLDIPLDDVDTDEDFDRVVPERLRDDLRGLAQSTDLVERVVYRLRYSGRTPLHRRLERLSENVVDDLQLVFDGVEADVDTVRIATSPDFDLDELADGGDPPGVLASLLLRIRRGDPDGEARQLMRDIRQRIATVHRSNAYAPLRTDSTTADEPDDDWIRDRVLTEGTSLLDEMLAAGREESRDE